MTFTSTTSWEQCRQVFDAIVLSNGWDDAAALQLLSHFEGWFQLGGGRGGGGGLPPGSVVMFDPRTAQIAAPWEGVAAWTGAPPLSPKAVPQSVPARVSVVLVEETPGRSARKLPSAPNSGNW